MSPRVLSVAVLLLMAGCATAPRTTYYTDGSGDYYYGGASADVIIDSAGGYYGYSGYGGYASPWGWNGGFGYGYGGYGYGHGYGYSPWWGVGGYGPGWIVQYPHASYRRDGDPDIGFRQGRSGRIGAPSVGAARISKDDVASAADGRQRVGMSRPRDGLPSSRYAPMNRAPSVDYFRAPLSGVGPRVERGAMPASRYSAPAQTTSRPRSSPAPVRAAPVYRAAPMNRAPAPTPAPSRVPSGKRE